MDDDSSIRNQIIITDDCNNDHLSNLELLGKYSKNEKNLELFKKLLLKNKNNFEINQLLNYLIMCVDSTASIDVIEFLIKFGADVNFQDCLGWTAIMNCSLNPINSIEKIKILINNGADVNIKSKVGKTALTYFIAISAKINFEIIKILLDNKADIYITNILSIIEDKIGKNSDIYSLVFNYKNIKNDHFCEYDVNLIYITPI